MSELSKAVNRNLMTLTLVERAMNQPESWTVQIGNQVESAQVIVSDDAVTFWASFASFDCAWDGPTAYIAHEGVLRAAVPVNADHLTSGFEFEWTIAVGQRIAV